MTYDNNTPRPEDDVPLEPWMLELAKEAVDELDASIEVPRAMMWGRIERQRRTERDGADRDIVAEDSTHTTIDQHPAPAASTVRALTRPTRVPQAWRRIAAIAAVLVGGVAIGRYVVPSPEAALLATNDTTAAAGSMQSEFARRADPSHVAMQEHLVKTVVLLAAVQKTTAQSAEQNLGPLAGELLATTRLLLDQPQLRDARTRRLLQDLELVLVQIVQARSSAPETQRAPKETMRETDLLTRVRAVVTASGANTALTYGGN